jgi:non-ribosomal peptide synthetase component F
MNVARLLHACAQAQPGDRAVSRGEAHTDYLGVSMAAQRIATILSDSFGVHAENHVAMMLPGVPELASVLFGILWAGAVAAVLDSDADIEALTGGLRWSEAPLLVAWHADAERAELATAGESAQCLFVEPREFGRLVGHTTPRVPLTEREPTDLAVVGRPVNGAAWSFTHAELMSAGRDRVRSDRLSRHSEIHAGPDSSGRELVLDLTAAVTVGAALVVDEVNGALTASHPTSIHGVSE